MSVCVCGGGGGGESGRSRSGGRGLKARENHKLKLIMAHWTIKNQSV